MELLECLGTIAKKLEITPDAAITLHTFNRGLLGKLGIRTAMAILADLVDRYDLHDESDAPTYGAQLAKLGVLTPEEGYLFAEGYMLNGETIEISAESRGANGSPTAFDGKA